MSKYNWENGTFKLPTPEYSKFKKAFVSEMQELYDQSYIEAISLYEDVLKEAKGKRNVDWHGVFHNLAYLYNPQKLSSKDRDPFSLAFMSMFRTVDNEGGRMIARRLNVRPLKPRKSDFKIKKNNKNLSFFYEDASVDFIDKDHCVIWEVRENNHAVERSREHQLGKLFFKLLNNVKWTKNTGGTIVGNDEYNQDSDYAGGGGNYVVAEYGLQTKKG